jgi:hypothetical protein
VFATIMGVLWLSVASLVTGFIGETFGMRWQAILGDIAFMSHRMGSFMGALGGGMVFDAMVS